MQYDFTATNTGGSDLADLTVIDSSLPTVAYQATVLAPGASTECTGTHTTSAADVSTGVVVNTAAANAFTPTSGSVWSTPPPPRPASSAADPPDRPGLPGPLDLPGLPGLPGLPARPVPLGQPVRLGPQAPPDRLGRPGPGQSPCAFPSGGDLGRSLADCLVLRLAYGLLTRANGSERPPARGLSTRAGGRFVRRWPTRRRLAVLAGPAWAAGAFLLRRPAPVPAVLRRRQARPVPPRGRRDRSCAHRDARPAACRRRTDRVPGRRSP
ncbi:MULTISPECIES: DUF7507 domain-containing protein [Pseudofrankia]|uniref:DUF7507 domain-containing protein n=1 Tax=Pseudofrankia TaxID=2994363 RepID=UPI003CC90EFD